MRLKFYKIILCIVCIWGANFDINAQIFREYFVVSRDSIDVYYMPDSNSEVKCRVYSDMLIFLDYAADEYYDLDINHLDSAWIPIDGSMYSSSSGYIFNVNSVINWDLLPDVPCGMSRGYLYDTIECRNDSIKVTMVIQDFDSTKHKYLLKEDYIKDMKIDGETYYGTWGVPEKEIQKMEIMLNGKNIEWVNYKLFYEAYYMQVVLGNNGNIYIRIVGSHDSATYAVYLHIRDYKIMYQYINGGL